MDLKACLDRPITLMPEQKAVVPTGLAMSLPPGFEAQVRSRSGLSVKGLVVGNSPGTIDSGYRGEVCVILHNHGDMVTIHPGDRIAQMVIARVCTPSIHQVEELEDTERGAGGLGSTGI
jgi:dUTP pyrophosphatase